MNTFDIIVSFGLLALSALFMLLCSYYGWLIYKYKRLVDTYITLVEEIYDKDKMVYLFCLKAIRNNAIAREDYKTAQQAQDNIDAQQKLSDELKKRVDQS